MRERMDILQDDITQLTVDAIVNAANRSPLGGGGDGEVFDAYADAFAHLGLS